MKIYFNGWFSGFLDKTNPGLHVDFFLDLFSKVYVNQPIEIGLLHDSDILCEFDMLIGVQTLVDIKTWRHTYLFSGESILKCDKKKYTCVLWGERNHKNVINLPLFIPYIYTNNFLRRLQEKVTRDTIPTKDVCVIVSNPRGLVRNKFLQKLEQNMTIDYAGGYKNNMNGVIPYAYNTNEFISYVGQYKFIISMENSRDDTYITEKIIHGLLAQTIPIYWGSDRIYDYINKDRILALLDSNSEVEMDIIIQHMLKIRDDQNAFHKIVQQPVFLSGTLERNLDIVARDIRCLLESKCWKNISRIYCVSNPTFEPDRCVRLEKLFYDLNMPADYVSYISPTYKHTITKEIYNANIKEQSVLGLRNLPMKKSELSLFLNYKAVLEDIEKNYKDGLFFVFESDVMIGRDNKKLNDFMDFIIEKKNDFDLIHVGVYSNGTMSNVLIQDSIRNQNVKEFILTHRKPQGFIEDITNSNDPFRIFRKFTTRCCDSFLWNYSAVQKFLHYIQNDGNNFGLPFDHYMIDFFEDHLEFKHYWTRDEFFFQGSDAGLIESTIQKDI